ncbi:MAG: SwmB domain-containing protein, partial [Acidimicrobiia bacterium]
MNLAANLSLAAVTNNTPAAVLTGTLADNALEGEIVVGTETLVITLTNDTWHANIGSASAETTALINGIDSAQGETFGWNTVVLLNNTHVVQDNPTKVTITLPAFSTYNIAANETISVLVPASALVTLGSDLGAATTFDVTAGPDLQQIHYRWRNDDAGETGPVVTTIVLTSGTTWQVPADWNNVSHTVHVIGGGGGGAKGNEGNWGPNAGGGAGGGGGGAYALATNSLSLTPSATINIQIGSGGAGGTSDGSVGSAGTDTWFDASTTLIAKGGAGGGPHVQDRTGDAGGAGGSGASSIGDTTRSGGTGGTGGNANGYAGGGGGGGGGAAGDTAVGSNGAVGINYVDNDNAGTGGAGGQGNPGTGGAGGAGGIPSTSSPGGTGTAGTAGTELANGDTGAGGGGGGGAGGSGGSSGTGGTGGVGASYGAGGGGGGGSSNNDAKGGNGANGTQGVIVITYTPPGGGATWAADQDTALSGLDQQKTKRLRTEISNEGAATSSGVTYQLQYATSTSGPWTALPDANWVMAGSSYITEGEATKNIPSGLDDANSAFVAGELRDTASVTSGITLTTSDFTELEYSVQATAIAPDDTYYFRVLNAADTTYFNYQVYPQVTLSADVTVPLLSTATVNATSLVLTYTELNGLLTTSTPANGDFTIAGQTVTGVVVAANTVTLTLSPGVANGDAVTISYSQVVGREIEDEAQNKALNLSGQAVTNNTPDTTVPVFSSAAVNGTSLVLTYTELNGLDTTSTPANGDYSIGTDGAAQAVTGVVVASGTVTLTLSPGVSGLDTITVTYTRVADREIQD